MITKRLFLQKTARLASEATRPMFQMNSNSDITDAVLAANETFYVAFAGADFDSMNALWAKQGPIAVEHPGAARIMGRRDVMESWRMILRSPPPITCTVEDVIEDEDQWAVICQEDLERAVIRMVNVFHEEDGAWKMIYHGPAPARALSS